MTSPAPLEAPLGWADHPIPDPLDEAIAALVARYEAAGQEARASLAAGLDAGTAATLLAGAERLATLAVRTAETAAVRRGLFAVALAWERCPEIAHAVVALGVLYEAARRTGEAGALFRQTAGEVTGAPARAFVDFLSRADLADVAAQMGFIEGEDGQGFRFYRTW